MGRLETRLEKLEQRYGGKDMEPLIVCIDIIPEEKDACEGIEVNGELVRPAGGVSVTALEKRLIAELETRRDGTVYLLKPAFRPGDSNESGEIQCRI